MPRRDAGAGHHDDPWRRRAPAQGIRSDRRRRRGSRRARRRRSRSTATTSSSTVAARCAAATDRQPRRPPPGDDVRDRRAWSRRTGRRSSGPLRPPSPIRASSPIWKGCEHDEARRPDRSSGGAFAVRARCSRPPSTSSASTLATSSGTSRRSSWPMPSASCATDDFLGANVTIPHKERVVPDGRPPDRGGLGDRRRQHDHARGQAAGRPQHRRGRVQGRPRQAGRAPEDAQAGRRPRRRRRGAGGRVRPDPRGLPAGRRVQPPPPSRRGAGQALRSDRRAHGAARDAVARVDHRVRDRQDQGARSTRRRSA